VVRARNLISGRSARFATLVTVGVPLLYSGSNRPDASAPFRFPPFVAPHLLHPLLPPSYHEMSSDREETDTTKSFTEHTNVVKEDSSIGTKIGQGVSYVVLPRLRVRGRVCSLDALSGAMKAIHGTSLRQ